MPGKYHSKICYADGHKFDSETERDYYFVLKERQGKGEISDLQLQVPFVIIPQVTGVKTVVKHLKRSDKEVQKSYVVQKETKYIADFVYIETATGEKKVVDVKSAATIKKESYQLKKKILLAYFGIKITEVIWQIRKHPSPRIRRARRAK